MEPKRYFEISKRERDVQNFLEWVFYRCGYKSVEPDPFAIEFFKKSFHLEVNSFSITVIHREKKICKRSIPDFVLELEIEQRKHVVCIEVKNGPGVKYNNKWSEYQSDVESKYPANCYSFFTAAFPRTDQKKHGEFEPFNFNEANRILLEWSKTNPIVKDFHQSRCRSPIDGKSAFAPAFDEAFSKGQAYFGFEYKGVEGKEVRFSNDKHTFVFAVKTYACVGYRVKVFGKAEPKRKESIFFKAYHRGGQLLKKTTNAPEVDSLDKAVNLVPAILEDLQRILYF